MGTPFTYPYAETILSANDQFAGANNFIRFDAPTLLELNDQSGLVAAQGGLGGLRLSARPTISQDFLQPVKGTLGGRLFIPCAGDWTVTIVRWGATGILRVPCVLQRFVGTPLDLGGFQSLAVCQQSINTQPTIDPTSTTIMTLSQRLNGTVAIAVNPLVTAMRFRFGASPAGTNYDIQVAAGGRYVFKEQELPLAELQAAVISGLGDNCKVVRYVL